MTTQTFVISQNTTVLTANMADPVLKNASSILQRDIQRVTTGQSAANQIVLVQVKETDQQPTDDFEIHYVDSQKVEIKATTTLG